MTRVVCYIRQSDEEGHKKDLSCPSQERRFLMDVAARQTMGEEVEHEIAPWDQGKSGGEIDRPGIQWVLANLDRFDEVWVYDHDRLAREAYLGPYIMRELRSRGIRLWVSTGGSDEDTPMGRFMTDLRMRFGALYREQIADRTKMNRDHRLRDGYWSGHAPTGYQYVNENGEGSKRILVPDPETAPKVRAIFRMLAEGTSQRKACALLGMNQTTVIYQKDNPLYIGLVYKLRENVEALEHRTYAALWTLAADESVDWLYPGRQEPLVDQETWDALEMRRQVSSKNKMSRVYGLSGRIRCKTCGGSLRIARKQGKRSDALRCEQCRWERSYRYAENTLLTALAILTTSPEFERALEEELNKEKPREDDSALDALITERAKVTRKLDRTLDLLIDSDEISSDVRQRAVSLKKRRDELDGVIAQVKAAQAARPTVVSDWRKTQEKLMGIPIDELWHAADADEQRQLLAGVFSRIEAGLDGMTFHVRGLEMGFQLDWVKGDVPYREVAGPGFEPGTP